jgi:hypothetical protein
MNIRDGRFSSIIENEDLSGSSEIIIYNNNILNNYLWLRILNIPSKFILGVNYLYDKMMYYLSSDENKSSELNKLITPSVDSNLEYINEILLNKKSDKENEINEIFIKSAENYCSSILNCH